MTPAVTGMRHDPFCDRAGNAGHAAATSNPDPMEEPDCEGVSSGGGGGQHGQPGPTIQQLHCRLDRSGSLRPQPHCR